MAISKMYLSFLFVALIAMLPMDSGHTGCKKKTWEKFENSSSILCGEEFFFCFFFMVRIMDLNMHSTNTGSPSARLFLFIDSHRSGLSISQFLFLIDGKN